MKKYTLFGVIGLIIVGGVGAYLYMNSSLDIPTPQIVQKNSVSLWEYVPDVGDQMLYLDVDQELIEVALRMEEGDVADDELTEVLQSLEEIVVYQYAMEDAVINLLFVQGTDELSIEQIRDLGVVSEDQGLAYESLGKNARVYGDSDALEFFDAYKGEVAADSAQIKTFLQAFRAGEYNVGFYSIPLDQTAVPNPLVTSFSNKLTYTYALSRMRLNEPFGRVVMQFVEGTIASDSDGLASTLGTYAGELPILFVEMSKLTSLVGIDEQQIQLFLPVLIGQGNPALSNLLSADDYAVLATALQNNIALSLTSQPGMMGVGLQLVFDDSAVYSVLQKLGPVWKSLAGPLGGGETNIEEIVNENAITYSLGGGESGTGLFAALPPMPLITIGTDGEVSYLAVLQDTIEMTDSPLDIPSTDRSRLIFRFDNDALLEALQASPFFQISEQMPMNTGVFDNGTVIGSLDAVGENDQVTISFSVK